MPKISQIGAYEILDCRGYPTIETVVILDDGAAGIASVPSGTSVGTYESFELRDEDPKRFNGKGVLQAIANVNEKIGPKLLGQEATKQQDIDTMMVIMDGTENKRSLGANSILSISIATAKAASASLRLPLYRYLSQYCVGQERVTQKLPTPVFNLINGGLHGVDNLDFQEFLLIPASTKSMRQSLEIGSLIYHKLKDLLVTRNANYATGIEGGYTPSFFTNVDGLVILADAAREAGFRLGFDIFLGLDVAASTLKQEGGYRIKDRPNPFSTGDLVQYYQTLQENYNILYLEDPFGEDDFEGFADVTKRVAETMYIVGDDLTTTNPKRLQEAITKKAINSVIIKPNQIGTITEAIHVALMARKNGLKMITSHRSGETNDDFIADFAVAISAEYAKFGAPARGERIAKYNRLVHIEEELLGK